MKAFKRAWLHFPIAKKTRSFTMLVIIVIALAVTFNLIINSLSLTSLGGMVRAASACTIAQEAMGEEVDALTKYVRQPRPGSRQALARAIAKTEKAISALPSDYEDIGPERYGRTWRVLNTYGEYAKYRDQIVTLTEREDGDIQLFYKISEMQGYISRYLQDLTCIPLAIADWFRYLLGVDDKGQKFECSDDPLLADLQAALADVVWNDPESYKGQLLGILSNKAVFGSDLVELGLAEKIEGMFKEMLAGEGAVRATLHKYI